MGLLKSQLLSLAAMAVFSASAYGAPPAGYRVVGCDSGSCRLEKIPDREIGSRFSSPTYESGDPFKAQAKTPGASDACPDGKCGLRAKPDVSAPAGSEITGCKDGTCAKPSSFAAAPPTPGAAAKGGCSTGQCPSAAAASGGAAAKGGGCSSGKKGKGGPFSIISNFVQAIGRALGLA